MHQEAIKQTNLSSLPDLQLDNTKSNIVIKYVVDILDFERIKHGTQYVLLCSLPRPNREKRSTRSDLLIASEISYIKQNQKVLLDTQV